MEAGRLADREQLSMRTAEEKVHGGKLVRVSVTGDGRVEITGDFFAHPEEDIRLIEDLLGQLTGNEPTEKIERLLNDLVTDTGMELIGVSVPVIVRLHQRCLTCGE
jgi:DNA-binding protein YbaB